MGDLHLPLCHQMAKPSSLVQKCDAGRPCTTCVQAKRIPQCVYNDEKHPRPADIRLLRGTDVHPLGQHLGDADPVDVSTAISTRSPPRLMSIPSAWIGMMTYEPSALQVSRTFKVDQIPHEHSLGLGPVRRNSFDQRILLDSNPPISISSFLPQTIPPEPWISPLSFIGEEKLQVQFSEINATDLDMRWYVLK